MKYINIILCIYILPATADSFTISTSSAVSG